MAVAGCVSSQGSESNNRWCLVTMHSSVVPSKVVGATSGASSWIPSGGRPCPPLVSEITVVVCPHFAPTLPTWELLHRCFPESWEVTLIKHMWALSGEFGSGSSRVGVFPGLRATKGGAQLQYLIFANLEVTGATGGAFLGPLVVAGRAFLWFLK